MCVVCKHFYTVIVTHAPPSRFAEARVWSLLNPLSGGLLDQYLDYAQGYNLTNPMPLMVPVANPLTVDDVMAAMRTHNEHTWFDNTGLSVRPDVGAQSGHSPYRTRPLVWKSGANSYVNERTVATQQSAWAFVAHSRSWLPTPIAALMWFAPDDSGSSPRIPVYGCATRIPPSFGDRYGQVPGAGVPYGPDSDAFKMSLDSAFWVWNLVGNIFQGEHNQGALPLLHEALADYQALFGNITNNIDAAFPAMYRDDPANAIEYVTRNVVSTGEFMTKEWLQFWMSMFVRFRDGGIITAPPLPVCQQGQTTGCTAKPVVAVNDAGYDAGWYARIVAENGPHYQVPASSRLTGDKLKAYSERKLKLM